MSKKEAQIYFSKDIKGDSIFQLRDGKLIFYYFRENYKILIYNEKTFQKLYEINLNEIITKFKGDGKVKINGKENQLNFDFENLYIHNSKNKVTIKELDNNLILIGYNRYLIEINLQEKNYEINVIQCFNFNIIDVNELPDKRIMVISTRYLHVMNKEDEEYMIEKKYPIKNDWNLFPKYSDYMYYDDVNQYFSSDVLPNERLLLNSFVTGYFSYGGCGTHPPLAFSKSKIIFIDLKNFEEIKSTEASGIDAKYIILEKVIVIPSFDNLIIYDINSLEIIKSIKYDKENCYKCKYDTKYLIALSKYEEKNNLIIYEIKDNDLIESFTIKVNISFNKIYGRNGYEIISHNNKFLLTLKDKRIIILCHDKVYILKLNII